MAYFVVLRIHRGKMDDLRNRVIAPWSDSSSGAAVDYVETPVDFVELKRVNPDVYAWLNIPDTVIDYPILRREEDNAYYLNHIVTGETGRYGCIFTETYNSADFSDFNTIIYGHNTVDGTMFGTLWKYKNKSFLADHKRINIYMPGRIMTYEVFAAYVWDDRHILYAYDFSNRDERIAYLDMIANMRGMSSYYDGSLAVTEEDKIITLSTCTATGNNRYLVHGVLIYDSQGNFTR